MDVKVYKKRKKTPGLIISARNHTVTLGLLLLFILGCIIGTLLIRAESPLSSLAVSMFKKYNGLVVSYGFVKNLYNLLLCNMLIIIFLFFMGLSAVGAPFVCIISVIKGIGIGIVSSYIYKTYLLSGFGYCMTVLYPQQIMNMLAMFIAMNESYSFSKQIFDTINSSSVQYDFEKKLYIIRFIFAVFIQAFSCIIGALLNTYISNVFIK